MIVAQSAVRDGPSGHIWTPCGSVRRWALSSPADLEDRIDLALLAGVASAPGMAYGAADAESVAAIYAEIARTMPCPADRFWGRR